MRFVVNPPRVVACLPMLQKIRSQQLRKGMYVERLAGSWLDHPFWRGSFLVRRDAEIDAIVQSGIEELWIDPHRGLAAGADDDEGGERGASALQPESTELQERRQAVEATARAVEPTTDFHQEVQRARRIYDGSRPVLLSLFEQSRLGRAIDTAGAAELVEEISESVQRNPWALLSVARLKTADEYTYMHSAAVCALMIALSRQLRLDARQTRDAGMAGLLHDVGKAMIPAAIINKPARLSEDELRTVRTHPELGYELLRHLEGIPAAALDVCLHHHEKVDGTGYPKGLPGQRISLVARMGAVCDVYDAITSNRPYKAGWDPAGSLRRMAGWTGTHFDEAVFQHFVKSVGIYPIGSFVRLESGLLGVVVEQGEASLLAPRVRVLMHAQTRAALSPRLIDLALPGCDERIVGLENPVQWGVSRIGEYL